MGIVSDQGQVVLTLVRVCQGPAPAPAPASQGAVAVVLPHRPQHLTSPAPHTGTLKRLISNFVYILTVGTLFWEGPKLNDVVR